MATGNSPQLGRSLIESTRETMRNFENFAEEHSVYAVSETATWDYERKRPCKKDVLKEDRRIYVHLFLNPERAVEEETAFNTRMAQLRKELVSGNRVAGHEKLYDRFFTVAQSANAGSGSSAMTAANHALP